MPTTSKYNTALEHFNSLVIKLDSGCWILSNKPTNFGYATFGYKNKEYTAHVFSYENYIGEIPIKHDLHHKCLIRRCVNPYHLEPLIRRDHFLAHPNSNVAININKTHCLKGHEFTVENTYKYGNKRMCVICRKNRNKTNNAMARLANALARM